MPIPSMCQPICRFFLLYALGLLLDMSFATSTHAKPKAATTTKPASVEPAYPAHEDVNLDGLVDIQTIVPQVVVQLKYATTDNFMKQNVYGGLKRCFVQPDVAKMIKKAHELLQQRRPNLTFIFYDCTRPRRVQLLMWDLVVGTKSQGYVANPFNGVGSVHNYGCAVDVGLYDSKTGKILDMGTAFDYFGPKAEPRREEDMLASGQLTELHVKNRLLLRESFVGAGFRVLPHEWWHFSCAAGSTAKRRYSVVE